MSQSNVNFELANGPVGLTIDKVSQWCSYSDFTKSTQYGILTMNQQIPAGSFMIGTRVKVEEAFDGGTNLLIVGKSSGADEFSDGATIEVGTIAEVGDSAADPMEFIAAAQSVYLRIDEGTDWDDVTAGKMLVEVYYLTTNLELSKGYPNKFKS